MSVSSVLEYLIFHVTFILSRSSCLVLFVHVSVADNGPGIGEAALPHIFERFYREDAAHVRSAGGAGLGLSIVKSIMHALGGSVSAESGEGKGTVIVLQLPYAHGNH